MSTPTPDWSALSQRAAGLSPIPARPLCLPPTSSQYPGHKHPPQLLVEGSIGLQSPEGRAGRADCGSERTETSLPRLHLHTNPQAASCKLPSRGHQDENQLPPT